jgi:hypothetical protein
MSESDQRKLDCLILSLFLSSFLQTTQLGPSDHVLPVNTALNARASGTSGTVEGKIVDSVLPWVVMVAVLVQPHSGFPLNGCRLNLP